MTLRLPATFRGPSLDRASPVTAVLAVAVMAALAVPAVAQLQFEEMGKRGLPANVGATTATAVGDVDGDGDLDLVVGILGQSRLYLNNGTGTFTDATATRMPVGTYGTTSLVLGDVDADGDLDLVVGNSRPYGQQSGEQSRLYLNNGTGTFTDATATCMPVGAYNTEALALGDVDGDGDLDLVLGNRGSSYSAWAQSRLYLNNGTGTFTDATVTRMPAGNYVTTSLALGDVDGDGDLDLVLGNRGNPVPLQQSRLYLNNGTGTFTDATATRMPVGAYNTGELALGDVDGDGDLDLVLGNHGSVPLQQSRLYLNNGTGTFTDATATRMPVGTYNIGALALGDVDGDGDLDLVLGIWGHPLQQSRLYLNDGTGTFADATATRMPIGDNNANSLSLADVDGDGDRDLVVGNWSLQNRLYLNDGTGTFTDATATPVLVGYWATRALQLGDVDGDSDLDLVVGNGNGPGGQQSRLYLNNGRGTFTDATTSRMPAGAYDTTSLRLGDVDGDGDIDMVLGNMAQQSRLYLNNGTGTFTDATPTHMPAGVHNTSSLAFGDVDSDGDLDLVVGNSGPYGSGQQSRLYLNNGTGTFTDATAARLPAAADNTRSLVLADVDGDGDLDLALGNLGYVNASSPSTRLYLNDGTGTFTDATATLMPAGMHPTSSLVLGDVDGDSDVDMVLGSAGQWTSVWVQNKYGGYWSHYLVGGQSRLYLNNGTGAFTDATATRMPSALDRNASLAIGDVDGDSDLDLVIGSEPPGRLFVNNGAGTFTDATATRMPAATSGIPSLALGDVDGDHDLDLVVGRHGGQNRLYLNLLRQLDAPFVLHVGRTYELDVHSRYGPATQVEVAFPYFSTATAHIPLLPFGTIGIDPNQMFALPPFVVAQPAGIGSLVFPVPNLPALAGITIYTQAILDQYPVQVRLTNVVGDVIQQ